MARRKGSARRRSYGRRRRTSRRAPQEHGILPILAGVGAVSVPFVYQDSNGYSVVADLQSAAAGNTGALENVPFHIENGLIGGLPDIVTLAALAVGANWAAKKFGLRRSTHVTKKWSLF